MLQILSVHCKGPAFSSIKNCNKIVYVAIAEFVCLFVPVSKLAAKSALHFVGSERWRPGQG